MFCGAEEIRCRSCCGSCDRRQDCNACKKKKDCNACNEKKACAKIFRIIKWTIRIIFIASWLIVLIILSQEVVNDLPTTYHIRMTRRITSLIVPSLWDDFGLPPKYDSQAHISSIIYPTTRSETYFMSAISGFMIDPYNFVVETQKEQRNKSALSVISNALAIAGTFLTLDVLDPRGHGDIYDSYAYKIQ
ncbi:10693_t:CDS:2 [Racocetra persica]|uniref:10693_t:CDS:1 n=1 Tax=Racocetra persica TaxID=160502 RepID=A0ACA9LAY8_9GLOM|nr:10693_t:CDS:2 [Racocetra persica]